MIYALPHGEFDFQGMYSGLLKDKNVAVCAGILRIFGHNLAELPLVATRSLARRQGHCRVFMNIVEDLLLRLRVGVLSLPAASAAVSTWKDAFHFKPIELTVLQAVQSELRLLMFPGSQVLYKTIGIESAEAPFRFAGRG